MRIGQRSQAGFISLVSSAVSLGGFVFDKTADGNNVGDTCDGCEGCDASISCTIEFGRIHSIDTVSSNKIRLFSKTENSPIFGIYNKP